MIGRGRELLGVVAMTAVGPADRETGWALLERIALGRQEPIDPGRRGRTAQLPQGPTAAGQDQTGLALPGRTGVSRLVRIAAVQGALIRAVEVPAPVGAIAAGRGLAGRPTEGLPQALLEQTR